MSRRSSRSSRPKIAGNFSRHKRAGQKSIVSITSTALVNDADNDFWLIYAYDPFRDEYLLLTITGPDAHNRSEWGSFLRTVHCDIVEPWIIGKVLYPDLDDQ
jgi:hypothetical protein